MVFLLFPVIDILTLTVLHVMVRQPVRDGGSAKDILLVIPVLNS